MLVINKANSDDHLFVALVLFIWWKKKKIGKHFQHKRWHNDAWRQSASSWLVCLATFLVHHGPLKASQHRLQTRYSFLVFFLVSSTVVVYNTIVRHCYTNSLHLANGLLFVVVWCASPERIEENECAKQRSHWPPTQCTSQFSYQSCHTTARKGKIWLR